jgi:hypothetical protein
VEIAPRTPKAKTLKLQRKPPETGAFLCRVSVPSCCVYFPYVLAISID